MSAGSFVSMVVEIVDLGGIALFEPERDPPVARDGYGETALQRSFERMKPEARKIHVLRLSAAVEARTSRSFSTGPGATRRAVSPVN
jgi:hypothetical protein